MKPSYKKLFLWSSLGSLVVGGAVTLVRKRRRPPGPPLECRTIPAEYRQVVVWTERFALEKNGIRQHGFDRYQLQPSPFQVWSVLDLIPNRTSAPSIREGIPIHHVTHVRISEEGDGPPDGDREQVQDRFYGVVTVVSRDGRSCGRNAVARGGILEFRRCYVGGASNGIESGEIHAALAPVLNYRIE
jgi:hypothetical protein